MKTGFATPWLMAMAAAVALGSAELPPRLDYELEDQFGASHTDEDCGRAVTILLGGGRKGSTYIDNWGPNLHQALATELNQGSVCSVGFAHLKGAPFFVKKKIVASFPKDPDAWIVLDWKGEIGKRWGAEKNAANIYVFDRGGELVMRWSLREFDQTLFDRIVETVQKALIAP